MISFTNMSFDAVLLFCMVILVAYAIWRADRILAKIIPTLPSNSNETKNEIALLHQELNEERSLRLQEQRNFELNLQQLDEKRKQSADDEHKRINELETQLHFMIDQWRSLNSAQVSLPTDAQPTRRYALPTKPLLLICGEESFCNQDRNALRQARIVFQRVMEATKLSVEAELRGKRMDGDSYLWVHVSAHADDRGVILSDGVADPDWWNSILDGIDTVLLATCRSSTVADRIAGLVSVVYLSEDLETGIASHFTQAFWSGMMTHRDAVLAFREALEKVPDVAEFANIRRRRG